MIQHPDSFDGTDHKLTPFRTNVFHKRVKAIFGELHARHLESEKQNC